MSPKDQDAPGRTPKLVNPMRGVKLVTSQRNPIAKVRDLQKAREAKKARDAKVERVLEEDLAALEKLRAESDAALREAEADDISMISDYERERVAARVVDVQPSRVDGRPSTTAIARVPSEQEELAQKRAEIELHQESIDSQRASVRDGLRGIEENRVLRDEAMSSRNVMGSKILGLARKLGANLPGVDFDKAIDWLAENARGPESQTHEAEIAELKAKVARGDVLIRAGLLAEAEEELQNAVARGEPVTAFESLIAGWRAAAGLQQLPPRAPAPRKDLERATEIEREACLKALQGEVDAIVKQNGGRRFALTPNSVPEQVCRHLEAARDAIIARASHACEHRFKEQPGGKLVCEACGVPKK